MTVYDIITAEIGVRPLKELLGVLDKYKGTLHWTVYEHSWVSKTAADCNILKSEYITSSGDIGMRRLILRGDTLGVLSAGGHTLYWVKPEHMLGY